MTQRRLVIAVCLTVGSLALGACGSSAAPTILNTEKVESAIEQSISDQRGQVADVSCPSGVHQVDALVFTCWATVGSNDTPFAVTQTDASGHVRYEADPR
ncbi:MAG: hypothetical protein QOI10_2155 [Solirubrobacterales bacterium]|nr:hypothetical protein [Solirubrobacterales bacterium]